MSSGPITTLALVSLVLLCGFISYYGDLQGRRYGKRRVSLFGMRPKHTAILITTLTGSGIAIVSIATLLAISPTVRKMVWNGEHLIDEHNRLLRHQSEQTRRDMALIARLETEIRLQQHKSDGLQSSNALLTSTNRELRIEQQKLAADKRQLQTAAGTARTTVRELVTKRDQLLAKRAALQLQVRREMTVAASAVHLNRDISDRNLQLTRDNSELAHTNVALQKTTGELEVARQQLLADTEMEKKKGAQLRMVNTALQNDSDVLSRHNEDLQRQVAEFSATISQLSRQREALFQQIAQSERSYSQSYLAIRRGRLDLRAGELLARRVVESHLRPEKIRSEVMSLLDEASTIALLRGARRGDNGRAVRIVNKRIVTLTGTQDADEADSVTALVDDLTGHDTPVVVMARAVNNSLEGEQIWVELAAAPIETVFERGAVIASASIDGRLGFDHVLGEIANFLQKDVHDAALKAGAIPQIDSETGQARLGTVEPQDLIPLTARVRRMGAEVEISAIARKTVTSADPLLIDFKLRRLAPADGDR